MIVPGLGALERFSLILIAVIFYLAIRGLQNVQEDLREIKAYVESVNERVMRLENRGF